MDIVRLKASHTEFKTFPSFKITLPHGSVSKRLNAGETAPHAVKATSLWSDLPPPLRRQEENRLVRKKAVKLKETITVYHCQTKIKQNSVSSYT